MSGSAACRRDATPCRQLPSHPPALGAGVTKSMRSVARFIVIVSGVDVRHRRGGHEMQQRLQAVPAERRRKDLTSTSSGRARLRRSESVMGTGATVELHDPVPGGAERLTDEVFAWLREVG